jgi:predicted acyl esterase
MFHGLGGSHRDTAALGAAFASRGYAVLAPDARAHGASGGLFSLDGPREVQDARNEFDWLAARPEVSDTQIGAWGISLGGGAVLNSAVAGVPWKALETVETWSDLYGALFPQNLGKSGAIFLFSRLVRSDRIDPALAPLLADMLRNRNLTAIKQLFGSRSSLSRLGSLRVPTLLMQGRRDFAFDIDQATQAYRRLAGPKALYIGDFGHPPSTFPGPDLNVVLDFGARWFDEYVRRAPVERIPSVTVAPDPWSGRPVAFGGVPPVRTVSWRLPGRTTIGPNGKVVRTAKVAGAVEQFGAPVVRLRLSGTAGWSHVVAVLSAVTRSGETVLSEGGAQVGLTAKPQTVPVRLISDGNLIPAGARLRVTVAATSTAQSPANLLYLLGLQRGARLTVGASTLTLPVLRTRVSR